MPHDRVRRPASLIAVLTAGLVSGCGDNETAPTRVAPPSAAASGSPVAGARAFAIAGANKATFLIDAPLEKIKGETTKARGTLQVTPKSLSATRGQVEIDLETLKTETFDEVEKNATQTEHAHNWLELGPDVDAKQRAENQWVRFTIREVTKVGVDDLSAAKEEAGKRVVEVTAAGDLWLHGVSKPKTARLSVTFEGPPEAPTAIRIKTLDPIPISLKEHDVKPRDVAGKLLQGALEKVGEKIDDKVQISIDVTAKAAP